MLTENIEKVSIFQVNPSKPTHANYILTDLYTSFEQVSAPSPDSRLNFKSIFKGSSILNPSIWAALTSLGLLTAVLAYTIDYLSQKLLEARYYMSSSESMIGNFLIWVFFSLFFASIAASTGKFISSDAEGSGIPEVKSILAGVHISKYLSMSTFFAKVAGLIASSAAGLSIGKEGPFVHLSAILANKIAKVKYLRSLTNVVLM
jgi:H+/Cl- antiporter ClcA